MKKVLLLSLGLVMGLCAFAQQTAVKSLPAPVKATLEKKALGKEVVEGTANFSVRGTQSVVVNEGVDYMDAEAFYTTYDLQSNGFVANRMYQAKDGSVAVTATMSRSEFDADFLDRGTGYNFADRGKVGKWGGISGVRVEAKASGEDMRTGWPTIAPYGAEGEILVNHADGLNYWIREKAGEGEWDGPHAIPNPEDIDEVVKGKDNVLAWPRIVTTGENNEVLHVFATASGDSNVANYYLRTSNLEDWTIKYSPLEMDDLHINVYSADDMAVSANGENIAVVYCAGFSAHVMLYESNDGGETWSSRMVWESPIHGLDWNTDENSLFSKLYAPTQASVAIGKDGVSHVALGVGLYNRDELGNSYSIYMGLLTDGVAYWNDTLAWEIEILKNVEEVKVTDTIEVEKEEFVNDTIQIVTDSTEVVEFKYHTAVDSTIAIDSTLVDSTLVEGVYEYVYDYTYKVDTVKIDTLINIEYVYADSIFVIDTTTVMVEEFVYDTIFSYDTVPALSPIRSSQDDSLKHALRLWWPTPENPESVTLDPTNFCAWMPPHKENGFAEFDYNKQYTGSDAGTAGDYMTLFGLTAYPSIAVDPAGNLAVAYSAPDLNRAMWNNAYYMRSIFVNYKPADSANWYQMTVYGKSLYEDFVHSGDEATFISAVSTPVNENEFWFSCLSDDTPGFKTGTVHSQANITTSIVNVFKYNPTAELNDTDEEVGVNETMDVVYNIFPNPASEYICISSSMDANATVTFSNIAGQTVKVVNKNLTTGDNSIVINDLTSGIYFCTVTANGYSHTSKVVVK